MNTEIERRRFHRFPFDAQCELDFGDGRKSSCELLDLSINGALLELGQSVDSETVEPGDLRLVIRGRIRDDRVTIEVRVRVVRIEKSRVACRFVDIDVESFARLRDLISENLGDIRLLDRELTQLDYWPGLSVSPVSD